MADEFTPTTDEVIDAYTQMRAREATTPEGRILAAMDGLDEFDRWRESEREAVRQEVRERIAQDIEAVDPIEWALAGQRAGEDAARIARGVTRG